MKILLLTDSPALPTGIADVTRVVFNALKRIHPDEYEIEQVGLFHMAAAAAVPQWPVHETINALGPNGARTWHPLDKFGEITLLKACARFDPDIVWAFHSTDKIAHAFVTPRRHKLVAYSYYDGFPMVYDDGPLEHCDHFVTMTNSGRDTLRWKHPGLPVGSSSCIYPPADLERFTHASAVEKVEAREAVFPDWMPKDAFVIGWVGRPEWRKQIWQQYLLIKMLRDGGYVECSACGRVTCEEWHPERRAWVRSPSKCSHCASSQIAKAEPLMDVFLWAHFCKDDGYADWSADRLESIYDVQPGRDIHYTEGLSRTTHLPPESMPTLYQIWDALSYLSGGEGFGLPAWEAMQCELPVVYTDYSAHAEFLTASGAGLPVGVTLQPMAKDCIFRGIAHMDEAVEAVLRLYRDRSLGRTLGAKGRAFCMDYTPEKVAERWHGIFLGLKR